MPLQLIKALADSSKPLATHYGAVVGLAALGPRPVQTLLLPALSPYMAHLSALQQQPQHRAEALRVYGALLQAVGTCVFKHMVPRAAASQNAMGVGSAAAAAAAKQQPGRGRRRLRLDASHMVAPPQRQAAGSSTRGAPAQPGAWQQYFIDADESSSADMEQEVAAGLLGAAAAASMRPVNEGREAGQVACVELPPENVLLQVWCLVVPMLAAAAAARNMSVSVCLPHPTLKNTGVPLPICRHARRAAIWMPLCLP